MASFAFGIIFGFAIGWILKDLHQSATEIKELETKINTEPEDDPADWWKNA